MLTAELGATFQRYLLSEQLAGGWAGRAQDLRLGVRAYWHEACSCTSTTNERFKRVYTVHSSLPVQWQEGYTTTMFKKKLQLNLKNVKKNVLLYEFVCHSTLCDSCMSYHMGDEALILKPKY